MKTDKLTKATAEARRFLEKVEELELAKVPKSFGGYYPSKHTAAVKRASMDLTRALAELRRP